MILQGSDYINCTFTTTAEQKEPVHCIDCKYISGIGKKYKCKLQGGYCIKHNRFLDCKYYVQLPVICK